MSRNRSGKRIGLTTPKNAVDCIRDTDSYGSMDVSQMPLLVVQEMDNEFQKSHTARQNLNFQGGLHPKHSKFILCIHVVHPCEGQVYVVQKLTQHTHYSIDPRIHDQFWDYCLQILDDEEDYVEYKADCSYTSPVFILLWNVSTPSFDPVVSPSRPFLVTSIYPMFKTHSRPIGVHNNCQIRAGYTGVSLKKLLEETVMKSSLNCFNIQTSSVMILF